MPNEVFWLFAIVPICVLSIQFAPRWLNAVIATTCGAVTVVIYAWLLAKK